MTDAKKDAAESFRDALVDVVRIGEELEPICGNVGELIQICQLALSNDGQLRLLMDRLTPKK